jgi:hypothetical protein
MSFFNRLNDLFDSTFQMYYHPRNDCIYILFALVMVIESVSEVSAQIVRLSFGNGINVRLITYSMSSWPVNQDKLRHSTVGTLVCPPRYAIFRIGIFTYPTKGLTPNPSL